MSRPRPVVLCILDGFGVRDEREANAAKLANTPALDRLFESCPHTLIGASGELVGLPSGQMGSSEVGHMALGAGRVLLSSRSQIDKAILHDELGRNDAVDQTVRICLYDECPLHLFGLLSDGGIHSHIEQLFAMIDLANFHEIPVVIHAFLDGRDCPPRSAMDYITHLENHIEGKKATIGTLSGRYYAMDRDERWDRVYKAFRVIVRDKVLDVDAPRADTPFDAVANSYAQDVNDEFLVPVRIGDYKGLNGDFTCDFTAPEPVWEWTGEDVGFAFNFRADRMRQLSGMFTRQAIPDSVANDLLMDRERPVRAFREHCYTTMTAYSEDLVLPVAFSKEDVAQSLGEILAKAGLKQLRCAESEKFAHVTYFFSGGREEPFKGETRILIPSPRLVETYDEKPEMSAAKVAAAVVDAVKSGEQDAIIVNFANTDMVGHTGILGAAVAAVEAVDKAIAEIAAAVTDAGGAMIITADHGNCETMVDDNGKPHTAHTTNPVPLLYFNEADPGGKLRSGGRLADVAPTLLEIIGIEQPTDMTGRSLLGS
jgi:2,3-bisphosphoglycerate-independent phosphoglycerate mutase